MMRQDEQVAPRQAPVRPRVPISGVLLEDAVRDWIEQAPDRHAAIAGGPLSGKSTAIAHVRAAIGERFDVAWIDGDVPPDDPDGGRAVYTTEAMPSGPSGPVFRLAAWGVDDAIEYLLHVRRERCESVMRRILAGSDTEWLEGSPALWRIVLDRWIEEDRAEGLLEALRESILARFDVEDARVVGDLAAVAAFPPGLASEPGRARAGSPARRLLALRPVQVLLAAERLAGSIEEGQLRVLDLRLERDRLRAIGQAIGRRPAALQRLGRLLLAGRKERGAASLLHAAGVEFRPAPAPRLRAAVLPGVSWPGIDLRSADLVEADLSGADLTGADLGQAWAQWTILAGARLDRANLGHAWLTGADLAGASLAGATLVRTDLGQARLRLADLSRADLGPCNLSRACLDGARLVEANLRAAVLDSTSIDGADLAGACLDRAWLEGLPLRRARLAGATFGGAILRRCDLEEARLEEPCFEGADLSESRLSGSTFDRPRMRGANLYRAGLAGIDWRGADLRGANLARASFRVEGSRGVRPEDRFDRRPDRDPSEFRTASLRGADLRGARVVDADFHLVDLRGALYEESQAEHFRRSGAILE